MKQQNLKCELCGDFHNTYIRKVEVTEKFKDENISYRKKEYYCQKSGMSYVIKDLRKLWLINVLDNYFI